MSHNSGKAAAQSWLEDYAPLLLSYDRDSVTCGLLSFCRLEMAEDFANADESTIYALLCVAFVQLHKRGAVQQLRPLSSEGERQLFDLLKNFNVVSSASIPEPVVEDTYSQVVSDYHNLSTPEFNTKLRTDRMYAKLFQEASDMGRV